MPVYDSSFFSPGASVRGPCGPATSQSSFIHTSSSPVTGLSVLFSSVTGKERGAPASTSVTPSGQANGFLLFRSIFCGNDPISTFTPHRSSTGGR